MIRKSFKAALDENDILISPAAPSAAYKIGMPLPSFVFVCLFCSSDLFTVGNPIASYVFRREKG